MTSILLIDDDPDVRDSIAEVLSLEGYDVETAENAERVRDLLDEHSYDVVITDIIMPGMSGVEAIRQARKIRPQIGIIAISGGGNFGPRAYQPEAITTTAYLQAAAEAGANAVLTKPFERAELINAVRRLVHPDSNESVPPV
jgi:CheY-like chemotaxis protein